jgi:chromosome segregation ATPase
MNIESSYEEIEAIVPIVNNNIIEFKKVVHKLNSNYRNNRISINFLQNDINRIHRQLNNINNSISELKLINSLSNLANKIDNNNHLNLNLKLACFGISNIIITSLLIHYLT